MAPALLDLEPLSLADRDLVVMLLRSQGVLFEVHDMTLSVPADRVESVRQLMRSVGDGDAVGHEFDRHAPVPQATVASALRRNDEVPGRWRRLLGWYIDVVVINLVSRLIYAIGGDWWMALAAAALYVIVLVATVGATVGKLAVGVNVVAAGSGRRPTATASVLRWLAVGWSWLLGPSGRRRRDRGLAATIVVYLPILWDPQGRGLHDRLAGTRAVRTRP